MASGTVKLSADQQAALDAMMSGKNVFLTGEAGTGKSTVLREFRARCDRACVVLAPTGVAAVNAGGATIHSFFMLRPGLMTSDTIEDIGSSKKRAVIRAAKTIIIDEISMVRKHKEPPSIMDVPQVFFKSPNKPNPEERIRDHIDLRKLRIVYMGQTGSEKDAVETKQENGVGFNKFDAPTLTDIAEGFQANGWVTRSELTEVSRRIQKYRRQWEGRV